MAEWHVFGDEAGTLQFNPKASRYFILTTITVPDYSAGDALLSLRREMAWEGLESHPEFHAVEELQEIRDRVFQIIPALNFQIDSTIFEKRKVLPRNRQSEAYFYQFAWFYHLKYLAYRFNQSGIRLLIVPATIAGRKSKQVAFSNAVQNVVAQVAYLADARCAFWMARTDPCLWLTDYCSWAIQRKYEHTWQGQPDTRSYDLIRQKIRSEFNIFAGGTTLFY